MCFRIITLIVLAILSSCSTEDENRQEKKIEIAPPELVEEITITENEPIAPRFEMLPSCSTEIEDASFREFYYGLIRSCLDYDSAAVIAAIHDSVKFSQYECNDMEFLRSPDCESCIFCSKEGIIKGVFGNLKGKQIVDKLFHMLTYYGVAPFNKNNDFILFQPIDGAYSNFNFKDTTIQKEYFRYQYILPKRRGIAVRKEMNVDAERINELPFKAIRYENEVGMGVFPEGNFENRWLPYKGGYVAADDVTSGFDYTLLLFEKTYLGWRITGFFEPPGC